MSVISNSFKNNAAEKFAKTVKEEDLGKREVVIAAWKKGFDLAEAMFTESSAD